jgi:hypothetical protein
VSEPRLSADGLYYWDGKQWVTTISPDGRSRWDGTRWIPLPPAAPAPMYAPMPMAVPRQPGRVPTSWTRPLQYVVAGAFGIYGLYSASLPFWYGGVMDGYMRQVALQQAQRSPELYPDPNQYADTMVNLINVGIAVGVIVVVAIVAVVIIGTLKRWIWLYYVILALLALTVIGLPFSIAAAVGAVPTSGQLTPPPAAGVGSIAFGVAAIALGAWMLMALITRGPWAMRRPSA